MLYSIGYEKLTVSQLIVILKEHNVEYLLDVRSKPYSVKPEFNKVRLCWDINHNEIEYHWFGKTLGGFGPPIEDNALTNLISISKDHIVCLLCMEHQPKSCHRYKEIGMRLASEPFNTKIVHLVPVISTIRYQGQTLDNYVNCTQVLSGNQIALF